MRILRRNPPPFPLSAPLQRAYADGIRDGFEIVLKLVLGERAKGGVPYEGPIPPELEHWARRALQRIEEDATKV